MKIINCKSCNAQFVYLETKTGSIMPVNLSSITISEQSWLVGRQKLFYNPDHHVSHFVTCPDAKKFRRKAK